MISGAQRCLAFVLLLAALAAVMAQPCIPCKECKTNNCFSKCKQTCPATVNIEKCKSYGADQGRMIGKGACDTVQSYCKQRTVAKKRAGRVTFEQCANIAFGVCQTESRKSAAAGACKDPLSGKGYGVCTKAQWEEFFNGEVDELCQNAVLKIPK